MALFFIFIFKNLGTIKSIYGKNHFGRAGLEKPKTSFQQGPRTGKVTVDLRGGPSRGGGSLLQYGCSSRVHRPDETRQLTGGSCGHSYKDLSHTGSSFSYSRCMTHFQLCLIFSAGVGQKMPLCPHCQKAGLLEHIHSCCLRALLCWDNYLFL